jgi:tRNA (guanosine-2'-O-)-methyltransferase
MTPERFQRVRQVLARRQPDLTVLLDSVHKPHNFSAILRSCDAVGVFEAHAVWPGELLRPNHLTSGGSGKWVHVRTHRHVAGALEHLQAGRFQIIAAHPGDDARDFREIDYTLPTALVLGAELRGLSDESLARADAHIGVPMMGMVGSLNVSVAAATILFEAQRQRSRARMYDRIRLEEVVYRRTLFEWAQPEVADYCQRHGLDYPELDDYGMVLGPLPTTPVPPDV